MKISITKKMIPFSKEAGSIAPLPCSQLFVRAFPTRVEILGYSLEKRFSQENAKEGFSQEPLGIERENYLKKMLVIDWDLLPDFVDFSFCIDLEKKRIEIRYLAENVHFLYRIEAKENGIEFFIDRAPTRGMDGRITLLDNKVSHSSMISESKSTQPIMRTFKRKETVSFMMKDQLFSEKCRLEKLFFGVHKKQDIFLMDRRSNMQELFPFWFLLGQMVPLGERDNEAWVRWLEEGNEITSLSLLKRCQDFVKNNEKTLIEKGFLDLYKRAMSRFFVPWLFDDKYVSVSYKEGLEDKKRNFFSSLLDLQNAENSILSNGAFFLLKKSAALIRELFFKQEGEKFSLLNGLPTSFPHGKLMDVDCGKWGRLDMEWSKKEIKRVIFHGEKTGEIEFLLSKGIKRFRMRKNRKDKGQMIPSGKKVPIEKGISYLFDRFQK